MILVVFHKNGMIWTRAEDRKYIQHSTLRLFANDSIIYKQIKNKEDAIKLQQDLDAAGKWEQDCSLMAGECTFKFLLMNPIPSDWLALAVMVLICLSYFKLF
jgi:hypothetical protein